MSADTWKAASATPAFGCKKEEATWKSIALRNAIEKLFGARSAAKWLATTGKRCHICGGKITKRWQADHVLAFSSREQNSAENYPLPAHALCNNGYRLGLLLAEEFQWILKIGVWARTLIKKSSRKGGEEKEEREEQGGFAREMAGEVLQLRTGRKEAARKVQSR